MRALKFQRKKHQSLPNWITVYRLLLKILRGYLTGKINFREHKFLYHPGLFIL